VILSETKRIKIMEAVRVEYQVRSIKDVRMSPDRVEVRLPVLKDRQGRTLIASWYDVGTPDYWHARVFSPVYPPM
jgi:hypothetical protein